MWYKKSFFQTAVAILLILLIIYLMTQLKPIFNVIFTFVTTLLFPSIIAFLLYYVSRPFRDYLEKKHIPRLIAILSIFLILFIFFALVISFIWPTISQQISEFTTTPKEKIQAVENKTFDILNLFNITSITREQLRETMMYYFTQFVRLITNNIIFTISSIAQIASYFIVTPFILFYLLHDDYKLASFIKRNTPSKYISETKRILQHIDNTLASYITGQVLVAAIVGTLIFIGYTVIGLSYAFLIALFAFLFNLIPFFGPIISTIPALLIGLQEGPWMALKVLCVVIIVHLLDLNLISPRIVGPRLQIHPVTIILLLVASVPTLGFLGLFIIVPLYAVLKVIILELYDHHFKQEAV